jgi:hypothetical protein
LVNVSANPITFTYSFTEAVTGFTASDITVNAPINATGTTMRGAYTRSLGGVFYDASVRLEPTQVAGFIQTYRSLIPESVEGSVPGSRFETFHLGFDQKLKSRTYFLLDAELLKSKADRTVGVFDYLDAPPFLTQPSGTRQHLAFQEKSLAVTINFPLGLNAAQLAAMAVSPSEARCPAGFAMSSCMTATTTAPLPASA